MSAEWTRSLHRTFKRGEVYFVEFDKEDERYRRSFLLEGDHRAVVLMDSTFPRRTVLVVPITSMHDGKEMIDTDVPLLVEDYDKMDEPFKDTIKADSFLMTNQVRPVTRDRLKRPNGHLAEKDLVKLDIQLISAMGLQPTIEQIIEDEVQTRLEEVFDQLGINIDDISGTEEEGA